MKNNGFTLIELSIVLIIIGLIVGGVLVGRDLIEAGKTRSFLAKAQQVETAFHTFRAKYNCLAGDCKNAAELGLGINGDGDRQILKESGIAATSCLMGSHATNIDGECQQFWVHLSNADMIAESIVDYAGGNLSGDELADYFPKWGDAYMVLIQYQGKLYLRSGFSAVTLGNNRANFELGAIKGRNMPQLLKDNNIISECSTTSSDPTNCPTLLNRKIIPVGTHGSNYLPWFMGLWNSCVTLGGSQWEEDGKCNILYRIN